MLVNHPIEGKVAIEIETLYGTGIPEHKILRTIETRRMKGLKTWILIPGITLVPMLLRILRLWIYIRKRYRESVKIKTLDIALKKLVDIEEIISLIKEKSEQDILAS